MNDNDGLSEFELRLVMLFINIGFTISFIAKNKDTLPLLYNISVAITAIVVSIGALIIVFNFLISIIIDSVKSITRR